MFYYRCAVKLNVSLLLADATFKYTELSHSFVPVRKPGHYRLNTHILASLLTFYTFLLSWLHVFLVYS